MNMEAIFAVMNTTKAGVKKRPEKNSVGLKISSWLDSSVGGALHRYRKGHGFGSHTGLNFFQAFFLLLLKWCSLPRRSLPYSPE